MSAKTFLNKKYSENFLFLVYWVLKLNYRKKNDFFKLFLIYKNMDFKFGGNYRDIKYNEKKLLRIF